MRDKLWIPALALVGVLGLSGKPAMAEDELLTEILQSHPGLQKVVSQSSDFRLQVVLGLVGEDADGQPVLQQHTYRAGAEYFYPASTVKLFAAVAAAQKIAALREDTGHPIDLDTPLVYHPLFEDDELEKLDPDNIEGQTITVRQEIREVFLVSDNQAYNYLYEMVGQDGLAESMLMAGLNSPRIVHPLSEFRTPEEHRQLPSIDFVGEGFTYSLPERTTDPLPPPEPVARLHVGSGYYSDGELVEEPMDFSLKNHFPLADLQRGLCMLVRPDVDCSGAGFALDDTDRAVILEAMSQFPSESTNPVYDPEEYPDIYVKVLLPGLEKVIPRDRIKIYNKTGQAYGFSTENAWVVDTETGQGFFLAATLYTNANGILNDDEYEYEEIAQPFMVALGEAVARRLWQPKDD